MKNSWFAVQSIGAGITGFILNNNVVLVVTSFQCPSFASKRALFENGVG